MEYQLVMTKHGMVPIQEIKEGTEVYSLGEWKIAPKPVKGLCTKCYFKTLPICIFEKESVIFKKYVSVNHRINLGKTKVLKDELAIRGYFKENAYNNAPTQITVYQGINYWYSKFIKLYGNVGSISSTEKAIVFYFDKSTLGPMTIEDFTERNLEYYLEGILRKNFAYYYNSYFVLGSPDSLTNDDKLVLRLLGIDCIEDKHFIVVNNEIALLSHIRDEYNKKKVKPEAIILALKKNTNLPEYTGNEHRIIKKEYCEDWMLPGINPDINGINPLSCNEKTYLANSAYVRNNKFVKNNFFEQLF